MQAARVSCSLLCSFDGLAPKRAVLLLDAGGERLGGCHASLVTAPTALGTWRWPLLRGLIASRGHPEQQKAIALDKVVQSVGENGATEALGSRWSS